MTAKSDAKAIALQMLRDCRMALKIREAFGLRAVDRRFLARTMDSKYSNHIQFCKKCEPAHAGCYGHKLIPPRIRFILAP